MTVVTGPTRSTVTAAGRVSESAGFGFGLAAAAVPPADPAPFRGPRSAEPPLVLSRGDDPPDPPADMPRLPDLPGVAARQQVGEVAVTLLLAGRLDLGRHQVVVAGPLDRAEHAD